MSNIQLFLKAGRSGKSTSFKLSKDATVEDLLKKASEWNGIDKEAQRIIFAGRQLETKKDGKTMRLTDYGIIDMSELVSVCLLPGGSEQLHLFDVDTKRLPEDVEATTAPDMITWDDDPFNLRAKMPCGHAITPASLTVYCRSLITDGKCMFNCPYIDKKTQKYCGAHWEYYVVRKLAVLTEKEKKEFETRLSENYLRKAAGIQECPKCSTFCMRKNRRDRRVICLACGIPRFEFCWHCLGTWKTSGTTNCGNDACTNEDPRLAILKKAAEPGGTKPIVGLKNCPSTRACPTCGLLIYHTRDCKHMVCPCGQKFCFICLKKVDSKGLYVCGYFNTKCTIAPVQTTIPGDD